MFLQNAASIDTGMVFTRRTRLFNLGIDLDLGFMLLFALLHALVFRLVLRILLTPCGTCVIKDLLQLHPSAA